MNSRDLPVYQQKERILSILQDNQVIVVESPTGSGKTTQLPIILHEAGYADRGIIGITQPRRIAAVGISAYIQKQLSNEMGEMGAQYAAYKMRFIDTTSPQTKIKIMTDGILLQEIKTDPLLRAYSLIMIDEAHERSLNIDFILGLIKHSIERRPDLKIIISSATINAEIFSEYFNGAPIVRIDTRTFPISVAYAPPAIPRDIESLIIRIVGIVAHVLKEGGGDMLVFLSGEKIIKDCMTALYAQPFRRRLHIIPLYGRLSKEEQDGVFPPAPPGKTKVILATNIAETSITIDGIETVIDSGLAKMNFYSQRSYTSSLIEQSISRASANQRRGRAGRTGPGNCYRLYRREDFDRSPLFTQEEIYRTDLSEVVLRMAELGIRDFESFDLISSPGQEGIASAVETLMLLNALEADRSLSTIGKRMSNFPLLPRHSRIIVEAMLRYPDVLHEVLIATSFLSTNSPLLLPQGEETQARNAHHHFRDPAGDFVSYLKMYEAFTQSTDKESLCTRYYLDIQVMTEIVNIKQQLGDIVEESGLPVSISGMPMDKERLPHFISSIAKGLIQFICTRTGRTSYQSLTAERIEIHPGSVMFREVPDLLVAGEIVKTSRTFARSVSPLRREWLSHISPDIDKLLHLRRKSPRTEDRERRGSKGKRSRSRSRGELPRKGQASRDSAHTGAGASPGAGAGGGAGAGHQIILGGTVHELLPHKGKKKILSLAWSELLRLSKMKHLDIIPKNRHLRVSIRYGKHSFMHRERLASALKIARITNPESDIRSRWPAHKRFKVSTSPDAVNSALAFVLKLSTMKKRNELAFITLYSDNDGLYWLRPVSTFNTSLLESLSSLESLADDIITLESVEVGTPPPGLPALKESTNRLYRRLNKILEDI